MKKDKYIQIFNYLLEFSKIRSNPVRDIDAQENQYPEKVWLCDIPKDDLFDSVLHPDYNDEVDYWIKVRKPKEPIKPVFPKIPNILEAWIDKESLLDEEIGPILHERIQEGEKYLELSDFPDVQETFDKYVNQKWLDNLIEYNSKFDDYQQGYKIYERLNETYKIFFKIHNKAQQFGEEYELIIGIGLLNFKENEDRPKIFRHVLTQKVDVSFEYSQRDSVIKVLPNIESDIQIESDSIVDLFDQFDSVNIIDAEKSVQQFLKENEIVQLFSDKNIEDSIQIIADRIRPDGKYLNLVEKPANSEKTPTLSFSPALILRKSNTRSFTALYETIIGNIENEGEGTDIPSLDDVIGIVSDRSDFSGNGERGNPELEDNTIYFPKEFNDEQLDIIEKAKRSNKVLVQGPPGTGKSHTIANLICHLLANGKKVLVTAYTKRALEVLKDKLPDEFQNLTVNLLSGDSSSINDLQASVNAINDELSRANLSKYRDEIQKLERQLQQVNEAKAKKRHELVAIHEKTTRKQSINNLYEGTLLEIAEQLEQDTERYSWYKDTFKDVQYLEVLDDVKQFIQQVRYYQNVDCSEYEYALPETEQLISVDRIKTYKETANELLKYYTAKDEHIIISSQDYSELKNLLTQLLDLHHKIELINLPFKKEVVESYFNNRQSQWTQKIQHSDKVFQKIREHDLEQIDRDIEIEYLQDKSIKQLKHDAQILLNYLKGGNALTGFIFKLKKTILTAEIKERLYFIDNVLVNGSPCNTIKEFEAVLNDLELKQDFDELTLIWGKPTDHKKFSIQQNYYAEIRESTTKLLKLLTDSTELKAKIEDISSLDINRVNVGEIEDLRFETEYNQLLRETERFKEEINKSKAVLSGTNIHPLKEKIHKSFDNIDPQSYKSCLQELADTKERYGKYRNYKTLESKLKIFFPELLKSIYEGVYGEDHIPELKQAIYYSHAQFEISRLLSNQYEERLSREIKDLEQKEKQVLATLASKKAWTFLIERLNTNPELTTHLNAFAAFYSKAKGKGKKALKFRKDVQEQMENCKESVPAWIMDLNRVADSISPKQGMYDYVIIDEASQLGPDAIFLMYIAKNVIIVGDDKQIAPQNVGVKANEMQPYIEKYLNEIALKNCFQPEFSFFDFARVFCGDGMIVLREHFRCMPEIIEFCNKYFYLPDRKGLYPLKQYSEKRLDPIKTVFCNSGFTEGKTPKIINRPEAEKIAETIAKLAKQEEYYYNDDKGNKKPKTFGVIVLQGNHQAALIENLLLKAIGETEYHNRKIVCGNSASFQGDERDIIFLSLITAHNHNRSALTRAEDERRFNVAVSRAKEQLWLFHSIQLEDLSNTNDLRFKLLDHCLNHNAFTSQPGKCDLINVPKYKERGTQPHPFDSWFEVEVYNDIVSKGYSVIPQYEVARGKYRIDLVALLPDGTKIAIECDGDAYHGPDQFQNDIMRQKVLERCGWQFFRVRGVEYYIDRKKALELLWKHLGQHDIPKIEKNDVKRLKQSDERDEEGNISQIPNKRLDKFELSKDKKSEKSAKIRDSKDGYNNKTNEPPRSLVDEFRQRFPGIFKNTANNKEKSKAQTKLDFFNNNKDIKKNQHLDKKKSEDILVNWDISPHAKKVCRYNKLDTWGKLNDYFKKHGKFSDLFYSSEKINNELINFCKSKVLNKNKSKVKAQKRKKKLLAYNKKIAENTDSFEKALIRKIDDIEIVRYSAKSIAIFGNTREIKDELKSLQGRFNPFLSWNNKKCHGWVVQVNKLEEITVLIEKWKNKF